MSNYSNLGTIGQPRIQDQMYKQLFGYPSGKIASFDNEAPGTSRANIFMDQIFSQVVPITAPTVLTADSAVLTSSYQIPATMIKEKSNTNSYIKKYIKVPLSSKELSPGVTYWFIGADSEYNLYKRDKQVENNLLNQGIPTNYDPAGGYEAIIYIDNVSYKIGNLDYPWIYNPNSGIVTFLGASPPPNATVTFTFWRYEGIFLENGLPDASNIGGVTFQNRTLSTQIIEGSTAGNIGGVTFQNRTLSTQIIEGSTAGNIGGVTFQNRTLSTQIIQGSTAGNIGGVTFQNRTLSTQIIQGSTAGNIGGVTFQNRTLSTQIIEGSTAGNIGGVTFQNGYLYGTSTTITVDLQNNSTIYPVFVEGNDVGPKNLKFNPNNIKFNSVDGTLSTQNIEGSTAGNIGGVTFQNRTLSTQNIEGSTAGNIGGVTFQNRTLSTQIIQGSTAGNIGGVTFQNRTLSTQIIQGSTAGNIGGVTFQNRTLSTQIIQGSSAGNIGGVTFQNGAITSTGDITTSSSGTMEAGSFNATSDKRLKSNIYDLNGVKYISKDASTEYIYSLLGSTLPLLTKEPINDYALSQYSVDVLKPKIYTMSGKQQIGFLADDFIGTNLEFLVNIPKDEESMKSLNYIGLIGLLTHEIKTLKKQVDYLLEKDSLNK